MTVVEALPFDADDLEVVEGDHGRRIAGYVEPLGGLNEFPAKETLFRFGECLNRLTETQHLCDEFMTLDICDKFITHARSLPRRGVIESQLGDEVPSNIARF